MAAAGLNKQSSFETNRMNASHQNSGFSISFVNNHVSNINIANDESDAI